MNAFSGWLKGIKGRLLFAATLPVIGFLILGAVSYRGVSGVTDLLKNSNENLIPTIANLGDMRQARQRFGYDVWAALAVSDPATRKSRIEHAQDAKKEFAAGYQGYVSTPMDAEEKALYDKHKAAADEYIVDMALVIEQLEKNTPEGNAKAISLMNNEVVKTENLVRDWNLGIQNMYKKFAEEGLIQGRQKEKSVFNLLILVTLFSAFLIFGIMLWSAANISNTVARISAKLTSAGSNVASSVEQLNEAGNSLSQSSTEAAASLEETVAALEEMTSMVQMNSDNAKQAAALSVTSREAAEHGEKEIHSLIQSMTAISQSSKKIEEIISVIDDIAFQTNLLALNAAVEAARAGEQGKGFAVVAEAVRSLAQRSSAAAKDISVLIKDSVSQIEEGSHIADQSGAVLTNITNSVKKVSDLNNEIAAASAEQATGIQQIGKAMNQLDQSSQSNAASAEEIAATSGEINNLAMTTQQLTHELNAVILGGGIKAETTPPAMKKTTQAPPSPAKDVKKNVVAFKRPSPAPAKVQAANAIPFDEDDRAKVGTTDGF